MPDPLKVRFRVDFDARCSVGIGKIELLEAIAGTGSLSQAARRLKMSYRRAWLLMTDLNASFDQPVVDTVTGGAHGGGAVLTGFGTRLVAAYRQLESSLHPLANRWLGDLAKRVATAGKRVGADSGARSVRRRSNRRSAARRAADG